MCSNNVSLFMNGACRREIRDLETYATFNYILYKGGKQIMDMLYVGHVDVE